MNYIPGFTNYLQASVPRYANGGAVMDDPRQAAVMPMTQEAVPDYNSDFLNTLRAAGMSEADLVGLSNFSGFAPQPSTGGGLEGLNFGLALPAGYVPQFEERLITAPISNKGNPTAYGANNQFYMSPNDFVRLVDRSTNSVVFEGTGYEAAQKAVEMGQNMTDTMGRKADYQIQTGKTQDSYVPVANEKYNKSTLSKVANVAGTVLPMAMMAIPGVNAALLGTKLAATTAGQIAFGALTGAASSGLKGQNVLKGAALGGLTAAGGALIPKIPAISDLGNLAKPLGVGIGATAGGLATGQSLKNSLLGGAASGALAYAAPSIQDAFKGIGQGPNVSAGSTGANAASGPAPITTVTGNTSFAAPVNIGAGSSSPTKLAELEPPATIVSGSGAPFAASFPIPASVLSGALPSTLQQPKTEIPTDEEMKEILVRANQSYLSPDALAALMYKFGGALPPAVLPSDVVVDATRATPGTNVNVGTGSDFRLPEGALNELAELVKQNAEAERNPIVSTASPATTPAVTVGGVDSEITPEYLPKEDIVVKATTKTTPGLGFTLSPDTVSDIDKKAAEEAEKKKKLGLEEYLRLAGLASGLIGGGGGGSGSSGTYGGAGGTGRLNPIFSAKLPPAGGLGSIGMNRTARPMGDVDWLTYGTRPELSFFDYAPAMPAPVTTPVPGNPAGPIMAERDPTRFAKGGRSEFAVNGAGTGRSDDIPAVLSDGEYVIDAETVALLGDGSNKAGAKKLDELRIKVRKHKGRKLAKGRFSANAKRPEAYLSGGRI